jgi:nicotinamide mononucleotide transporter
LNDLIRTVSEGLHTLSAWEAAAVLLAVAYLVLIIRQNAAGWPAAIASGAIYLVLMFRAGLYMQSALQAFYIAMAAYGWWNWSRGEDDHDLPVVSWPARAHAGPLGLILAAGLLSGFLLHRHTEAVMPYPDALAAWGAIVTTWLVARKVLQNWHYWFVIDAVSIYLYASRGLWLTAALFTLYLVLIVIGYRQWRASMEADVA